MKNAERNRQKMIIFFVGPVGMNVKLKNWKCYVMIRLSWNCVWLLSTSSKSTIYHIFDFRTYSRQMIDVFTDLTKTLSLAFSLTLFNLLAICSSKVFQTLHHYNLAGGLPIQSGLINLTLFQGQRCVRIINSKLFFSFQILVHSSLNGSYIH